MALALRLGHLDLSNTWQTAKWLRRLVLGALATAITLDCDRRVKSQFETFNFSLNSSESYHSGASSRA